MRALLIVPILALIACDDTGTLQVPLNADDLQPDGDTDLAASDTDGGGGQGGGGHGGGGGGSTDTDVPVSANDCGPYNTPPADLLGTPSLTFSGKASASQSFGGWSWKGCEVERHFDADGNFECEIWRAVKGDGNSNPFGSPGFVYDLTFKVDPARTTCATGIDLAFRYGVDTSVFSNQLDLFRAPASGGNFTKIASAGYTGNFTGVGGFTFRYATAFQPQ